MTTESDSTKTVVVEEIAPEESTSTDTKTATEPAKTEVEPEDLSGLKSALSKERAEKKAAATALKAIQDKFKDLNPEEYDRAIKELETTRAAAAKHAELEAEYKTKADRIAAESTSKINEQLTRIQELERRGLIKEAFLNSGGNHVAAEDGTSYYQLFEALQGNKFTVKDGVLLTTIKGSDGKDLTPEEYIKTLHEHSILGNCFTIAKPPGGTGNTHEGGSGKVQSKPISQMTQAERRASYEKAIYK